MTTQMMNMMITNLYLTTTTVITTGCDGCVNGDDYNDVE